MQQRARGERGDDGGGGVQAAQRLADRTWRIRHGPKAMYLADLQRAAEERGDQQPRERTGAAERDGEGPGDDPGEPGAREVTQACDGLGRGGRGRLARGAPPHEEGEGHQDAAGEHDEREGAGEQVVGFAEGGHG